MRFLRNREIKVMLVSLAGLSIIGIIFVYLVSPLAAGIMTGFAVLLFSGFILFTAWRYSQLDKLALYLQRISNGDYALDVRDNAEGELSLLPDACA